MIDEGSPPIRPLAIAEVHLGTAFAQKNSPTKTKSWTAWPWRWWFEEDFPFNHGGFMEFWSPGWYGFLPRFLEAWPVVDAHLQLCRVFGPWPKWEAQPADVGWDGWMDVGRDPMKTSRNLVWILDVGSNSFNVFSLQSAVGLVCLFFFYVFLLLLLFVVVCCGLFCFCLFMGSSVSPNAS